MTGMAGTAIDQTLAEIHTALRNGDSSAVQLVETAIENHRPEFDAYRDWQPDGARRQAAVADAYRDAGGALGPLFGFPVSVKDLYGVRGFRTFAGSPKALPEAWEAEGPLVRRVRGQLGVVTGKTHTVEFAFGGVGANPHHPVPRNPWDAENHRVAGGSSSGAGVSLVEGSAVLAFGSDTGGSVRIPASVTGTVGLKTSTGRWPLEGIVPLSPTLDTAGILVRDVADAIYAFGALDPAWGDPLDLERELPRRDVGGLRLGVGGPFFWDGCGPGVAEGVRAAIDELDKAGARLVDCELPETTDAFGLFSKGGPVGIELHAFLGRELPEWLDLLEPIIRQRIGAAADMAATQYLDLRHRLRVLAAAADRTLSEFDALVTPTVAATPPTIAEISDFETYVPTNLMMLRNTSMGNYLDFCAITLPVALDDAGMPVGLQLMARHGHEEHLLAVARAVEKVLGTGRERLGRPPGLTR